MIRSRLRFAVRLCLLLVVVAAQIQCGKRGPPLAPLVFLPGRVAQPVVRRLDDTVYVQFRIPTANSDNSVPADLVRMELYALTTHPAPGDEPLALEDWMEVATLVGTAPVRPPDPATPETEAPPADAVGSGAAAPPVDAVQPTGPPSVVGADGSLPQGAQAVFVERLTPETFVAPPLPRDRDRRARRDEPEAARVRKRPAPLVSPPPAPVPRRTYIIIGISSRGRESPPSSRTDVPLIASPDPPSRPAVSYNQTALTITWEPPDTARLRVQEPATGTVLDGTLIVAAPAPSRYDVYDVSQTVRAGTPAPRMPTELNPSLLSTLSYTDRRVTFGQERCYAVRLVDVVDSLQIRSAASRTTCVTPVDTFAPAAPTGLRAIGDQGIISLAWDESTEADVAGYLVLRGLPPGETLQPLTPLPIAETTYRDADVEPGQRYVYAVRAVDAASPANVGPASATVVEVAR